MQVRLTRDEVEHACEAYVLDRIRTYARDNTTGDSWKPDVVDVTFHQTGMGATVEVEWHHDAEDADDDSA